MNRVKRIYILSLMISSIISVGCQTKVQSFNIQLDALPALFGLSLRGMNGESGSCKDPQSPEEASSCKAEAAIILASTVRFQISYWFVKPDESGYLLDSSVGHGTVMDGRFLVTHNHFKQPFSDNPEIDMKSIYAEIQIFDTSGKKLSQLPVEEISIVVHDEESLLLDFKEYDGVGFFEALGLTSAEFKNWHNLTLKAGVEIAQVDWDGEVVRIDWTTVQEINVGEKVTRLVMSDGLFPGASGGGIFLGSVHIGNNWTTVEEVDISGSIVGSYSTAALNTERIMGWGTGPARPNASPSVMNVCLLFLCPKQPI